MDTGFKKKKLRGDFGSAHTWRFRDSVLKLSVKKLSKRLRGYVGLWVAIGKVFKPL